MVKLALGAALACLLGCLRPTDYQCASDRDCDVGEAGRCELDHRCTRLDPTCPTLRRYSDHSGPPSNVCFDDHVAPLNRCAAGQAPAVSDACVASVCEALPSCCEAGWSEACVQQAQLQCDDLICDTRIAITATKAARTELWDLRWDGAAWTAQLDPRQSVLAWLAPAPGQLEPELVGFTTSSLMFDDHELPVSTKHNYLEATSVDFDRDGRPTAVLGFTDTAGSHLEVMKLDDGTTREVMTAATTRLSWGDVDHDAFPDGIAAAGSSTRYHPLSSTENADHLREIDDRVSATMTGGTSISPAPPAIRSFDWLDLDGDHLLDAVAYGFSVDVHLGKGDGISTTTLIRIDCDPPTNAAANDCNTMGQNTQSFAGAALPAATAPTLLLATHPRRGLYRVEIGITPTPPVLFPYAFPIETCRDAAGCPPVIAVVVRDLDGDHALDVIAIDSDLQVYTALAKDNPDPANLQLRAAIALPTSTTGFLAVRTSVTGAPR